MSVPVTPAPYVISMDQAKVWGDDVAVFYCFCLERGVPTDEWPLLMANWHDPAVSRYSMILDQNRHKYPKEYQAYLDSLHLSIGRRCKPVWEAFLKEYSRLDHEDRPWKTD